MLFCIVVVDSVFIDEPLELILFDIMRLAPGVIKQVRCLINRFLNIPAIIVLYYYITQYPMY